MTQQGKVAYVFPGQGAQFVGMGRDLAEGFATAKALFKKADDVLKFSISKLCFDGPEEELRLTSNTQPALLAVSYICLKIAQETAGAALPPPAFVAGHSLGEYTALAAADVIDFTTAIFLARERGRLMHEAGMKERGGMAAVLGLDEAALNEVCKKSGTYIANYNSPGQLIISGAVANIAKATEMAQAKGASRVIPLQVSGAFHSPLMKPAREKLSQIIDGLSFRNPTVPVIANVTGQPLTTGEKLKTELIEQLCTGVQWQRSVETIANSGITTIYEFGPGKVLNGLIKRINKEIEVLNIGDAKSIENLRK